AAQLVQQVVAERIPRRFGFDPIEAVQVLTPMHRGPAGTAALNEQLQRLLNPSGAALEGGGASLRVGDKVLQTRNDYDKEVFNGDLGRVVAVSREERSLVVRFDGRDVKYE